MKKRNLSILLSAALILLSFLNFGSIARAADEGEADVDVSELEHVEIPVYLTGGFPMPDNEMVNDAVNDYLKDKLNVALDIYIWPGSEYQEKMPVKMNAQEDVGIVCFGSQSLMDYVQMAQRGQVLPIDELLDEYAPETKALFDSEIWDTMRVDGEIYGVPSLKDNCYIMSFIYNKGLAEDLGLDMDFDFTNWCDMEDWLMKAKEARDEKYPGVYDDIPLIGDISAPFPYYFNVENFVGRTLLASCNIDPFMQFAGKDVDEVFCGYKQPEFRDFVKMKVRLVEAGVHAYDYTDKSEWEQSEGFLGRQGWGYTYISDHQFSDNWVGALKVSKNIFTDTYNYQSAGTSISSNSVNPERCMQVINLFNTDKELTTMLRFGIEGEHYVRDENGKMDLDNSPRNSDPANRGHYYWYFASLGNLMASEAPPALVGPNNEMLTRMAEYNDSAVRAAHMGFVFDQKPIENEYAACSGVIQQYMDTLVHGQYDSEAEADEAVDAFIADLEANGVDKIVAECQSQLDAWIADQA